MNGKKARALRKHVKELWKLPEQQYVAYRAAKALHPVTSPKIDAQALKRRRKSVAAQRARAKARRS